MPASYASRRRNVARTLRQLRPPTKFTPPPSYESEGTPALRPAHMGSRQITPPPTYVEQETPTRLPADTERESASPPPNYIESARTPCRHVDFSSPAPQQEPLPLFLGRNGNEIEALLPHSMLQAANWQPHSRHLLPPYDHNGTEPQWGNDSNRRAGPIHELDYRAEQSYESFEEPPSSDSDVSEYQPDPLARGKYKRVRRGSEHAGGLAYGTQIFRFPPLQEPPVSTRSPAHAGSGDSSQTETDEGTTTRVRRGRRKLVLKSKRPGKRKVENKIILAENVKPEELRKLQSDCEDLFDRIPQSIGQCSAWEDELIGIAKLIPGKPGSLVNTTQEEVLKYVFKSITRYPDNVWISIIAIQINRPFVQVKTWFGNSRQTGKVGMGKKSLPQPPNQPIYLTASAPRMKLHRRKIPMNPEAVDPEHPWTDGRFHQVINQFLNEKSTDSESGVTVMQCPDNICPGMPMHSPGA